MVFGQTGSGKTYTLYGREATNASPNITAYDREYDSDGLGVVPRALSQLFDAIAAAGKGEVHQVRMSYLEVYEESIRDLVAPFAGPGGV
jgi:hypothetical protein